MERNSHSLWRTCTSLCTRNPGWFGRRGD